MERWIEEKYLRLIGGRFRNFKQKGREVYNWSCHSCGDSSRDKRKARAYAYVNKKGEFKWTCHNCSDGGSISYLVKSIDEDLYHELLMERFETTDRGRELAAIRKHDEKITEMAKQAMTGFSSEDEKEPELLNHNPYEGLTPAVYLDPDHPGHKLLTRRMIPAYLWTEIFHADYFYAWAHMQVPEKYADHDRDEPRLVIPFMRGEKMIGFQGRSYGDRGAKYISVVIDKEAPFLYGWNRLDGCGDVPVVEGPIDSMFLRNGLATGGGQIQSELLKTGIPRRFPIIVYDNEPRNRQVVQNMMRAVTDGWRVCVWPTSFKEKDVNEMVMNGVPAEQVQDAISKNAYSGLEAELMISQWKRCQI